MVYAVYVRRAAFTVGIDPPDSHGMNVVSPVTMTIGIKILRLTSSRE